MSDPGKRIAVIGAGVAGLATLRHLLSSDRKYIPTCFERGSDVGGIWIYNKNTHTDEHGMPVFTSIYRDLRTNIPKELMAFPDFPTRKGPSYWSRPEVCDYLQRYADEYGLRRHIKLNSFVQSVVPHAKKKHTKWTVYYSDIRNQSETLSQEFDAVIVCNGHHEKAHVPDIDGIELFQGEVLHSHNYRRAEHFKDKKVVILGAMFSGLDMAVGISPHVKQLFLSHVKERLTTPLPENVIEKVGIQRMTGNSVVFLDDTEEEVDVLLFSTGYRNAFAFLSDDVITIDNDRVTPIYKHIVHIQYHSLLFVGLTRLLAYFPHDFQIAKAVVAILNGDVTLPSENEMHENADNDFNERKKNGFDETKAHFFGDGDRQWIFNRDIAKMAGCEPLPPVLQALWDAVTFDRGNNFLTFRDKNYAITGPDTFVEL